MAGITTHVLDTAMGKPASGIAITLYRIENAQTQFLNEQLTNHDGRTDSPILASEQVEPGIYQLTFQVQTYLSHSTQTEKPFYDEIHIRFQVIDTTEHYHIPLLLSPFGYSTYRGS